MRHSRSDNASLNILAGLPHHTQTRLLIHSARLASSLPIEYGCLPAFHLGPKAGVFGIVFVFLTFQQFRQADIIGVMVLSDGGGVGFDPGDHQQIEDIQGWVLPMGLTM